jgi:hypothetical protein
MSAWLSRPGGRAAAQPGLEILAQPGNNAGPARAGEGAGLEAELAQPRGQVPAQPGDRVPAQPGDDAGGPGRRRGRRPRREARKAAQPGESDLLAHPGRRGRSWPSRDRAAMPAWLLYAGPIALSRPRRAIPAWKIYNPAQGVLLRAEFS